MNERGINMSNVKIKTKGMHCTSCEMLIKDALEELDGVQKAEASCKEEIVSVNFDDKKIGEDDIIKVIKSEGYETE